MVLKDKYILSSSSAMHMQLQNGGNSLPALWFVWFVYEEVRDLPSPHPHPCSSSEPTGLLLVFKTTVSAAVVWLGESALLKMYHLLWPLAC